MSSIFLYLVILIIGGFLSYKGLIHKSLYHKLDVIQMFFLFVLLFTMGLRIGMDDRVLNAFAQIGMHAVLFASVTVVGSVFMVFIMIRGYKYLTDKRGNSHDV